MNYLLIENKGEIDVNSFILMGGSTKRGDEKAIGYFGSGNKYALALSIKEKIPLRVFAGNEEFEIKTRNVVFREKNFEQIIINGLETSLTTDMGPQWEIWQIVREFVSNAIDEGGFNVINSISNIEAREGYTRIYIPHIPEIEEVIANWQSYFAFDRTDELVSVGGNKIYPQTNRKEHLTLYRKNIRCFTSELKSFYQYDLNDFHINESRVVEHSYKAKILVTKFLADNASVEIAFRFLTEGYKPEYWESDISWYYGTTRLNPNWRTAIGNRVLIVHSVSGWFMNEQNLYPHFFVTEEMARAIRNYFPEVKIFGLKGEDNSGIFRATSATPRMEYMLKKARDFFKETNYEVYYPIVVGQFNVENQWGGIGINEIHISEKVFDHGLKDLVSTIAEENEHLKTNHLDCTREFQNHWIKLFITEKEERFAYYL